MPQVTRMGIASMLDGAFEAPRRASELVEIADARGAEPEVVDSLRRLPERPFTHLRELWEILPEIPIGD